MSKFILSAFADEISPSLTTQINVLKRQSIHYMELRSVDEKNVADFSLAEAQAIKDRLDHAGIGVSALGSPIGKVAVSDAFEPHFAKFCHVVELAGVFATPNIRIFSFFIPQGEDPSLYRAEVLARLERMVSYAREHGVVLLHENEKHIYGDTARRCLDLMQALHCPSFAMTYDPSNFVQCNERNYPGAFELLRPYIRYMHMKDSVYTQDSAVLDRGFDRAVLSDAHRPVGEGEGDVAAILRGLKNSGYEGFVSIEPHLSANPLCGSAGEDTFAVAAYALRKLINNI